MSFKVSVLKGNGHCKSRCLERMTQQAVCRGCKEIGHKFVHPTLRACDECLEEGVECVKMVSLEWIIDSESKNKNSQQTLSQNQGQ